VRVCSLVIYYANLIFFCAGLCCHLWLLWLYHIFSHYLINARFSKKKSLNIKRVFWFPLQLLLETFLILRIIQRDNHVKYQLFPLDFNENWILSTDFRKNNQISSFVKIRPVGTEFSRADRQTDMTKLIVTFRSLTNAPNYRLRRQLNASLNFQWDKATSFRDTRCFTWGQYVKCIS
jgi:hypothetical protein